MKPFGAVAVVGTGAVGGSIAGSLRARGLAREVRGVDPANAEQARSHRRR